jgi:XRE family transcriptional regulator, regulator of sulfur utilization
MPKSKHPAATAPQPPRVGAALASLRQQRGLSLDELSRQAGVSKSMLSQIERDQAFGVPVTDLLGGKRPAAPQITMLPAHATPTLASPDGKCELRILGPIELAGQFEWYSLTVQPGGELASQAHEPGSREHLTVLSGQLEVRAADQSSRLRAGETARYAVDVPHRIHNPGKTGAQALLVVLHPA